MEDVIKLKATAEEIKAICEITDTLSAMIGNGESDELFADMIEQVDKMLKRNKLKRDFK